MISSLAAALTACGSGNGEKLGERVVPFGQPVPKGGGVYRIGSAYQVDGVWYQPKEDPAYDRVGTASWYGELFHGRRTANGEIYDMDRLSAAHPTLPLPVYARVTNLQNGRSIIVRINDRGPYANDRIIDLSRRSAELLGYRDKGTAQVRVQFLARAPLNGDDSYERRYLANQRWMTYAAKDRQDPVSVGSLPKQASPAKNSGWKTETKPTETVARNDPPPVKSAEIAAANGTNSDPGRFVQEQRQCRQSAVSAGCNCAGRRDSDRGRRRHLFPRPHRPLQHRRGCAIGARKGE